MSGRSLASAWLGCIAALCLAVPVAQAAAASSSLRLWRLDCGEVFVPDLDFLNDSFAFSGQSRTVSVSCYLIRHGTEWFLWDTGLPLSRLGEGQRSVGGGQARLARSLADQLRDIGVAVGDIQRVGLSHYHSDHSGQVAEFAQARLLIGAEDWAVVQGEGAAFNLVREEFTPWLTGGGSVDPVTGDRDVFGDGSVVMLATPGHTPGHHSLLVRLKRGPVLLTGDLWHFRAQMPIQGVPKINTNRADSLASMDRIQQVARQLKARIVLGHEREDRRLLPAFPASAE